MSTFDVQRRASPSFDVKRRSHDWTANRRAYSWEARTTLEASAVSLPPVAWLWYYEADLETGFADGDPMGTWDDFDGTNDATQGTSADQPRWHDGTGAKHVNNQACFDLDGLGDHMDIGAVGSNTTGEFWAVVYATDGTDRRLFDTSSITSILRLQSPNLNIYQGGWKSLGAITLNSVELIHVTGDGSSFKRYDRDGVLIATVPLGGNWRFDGNHGIGRKYSGSFGNTFEGRIAFIGAREAISNASDRADIVTYLASKYGV